jgi:hypothetical protein
VTAYKRQGSPHWVIEFQHLGQHVHRSSGTTSKAAAKVLEQKCRQEIYDRVKLGKAATITLGEAAARYYETTLKPGGKRAKLARDLGYLKQIKDAFGADRKLSEITQAEVAKWRDEFVTKHGLLFIGGVMNPIWVAGIAIYVALEKDPAGRTMTQSDGGSHACRAGRVCTYPSNLKALDAF